MIRRQKYNLNKYYCYLNNGLYYYNKTFTELSIKKVYNNSTFETKNFMFKRRLLYFLERQLFSSTLEINDPQDKKFSGDLILIPSTQNRIKIFNDEYVITIFNSQDDLNKWMEGYQNMSNFFNTPCLRKLDENKIIENNIKNKPKNNYKVLEYIINCYIKNAKKIQTHKVSDKNDKIQFEKYFKKYSCINEYIKIIQHGDMWSENILYDGDKFYVIDYEKVKQEYFLYDFFLYIYNEMILNNNSKMLDLYFNGEYNFLLERYFTALNIDFNEKCLEKYFVIFLYRFMLNKFSKYRGHKLKKLVNRTNKLLNKYQIRLES